MYAITAEQAHVANDAYAASAGAWRIASTGHPWFDGMDVTELAGTHGVGAHGSWISEASNGHVTVKRMAGPVLAGIPFYWLMADGTGTADFDLLPGAIAASCLSAGSVLFLFLAVRRRISEAAAVVAALLFAFTTPTWSVSANGLWTHSVTQFGIAAAAYACSRQRWWCAGCMLGIGMLGRPHVALIAAAVGLGVAWSRRDGRPAIAIGLPSVVALGILASWNRVVFGQWSIGGAYGDSQISQAATGLGPDRGGDQWLNYLGFLVSADKGFLVWSPLLIVLVPAVVRSWSDLPDWTRWLVAGGALYTFFQLRLNYFAGGEGFHAYRHGLELLTCLAPVLALSSPKIGALGRRMLPLVASVQFGAVALGASVEGYFVPLERVWRDNSLWLALRHDPWMVGMWMMLCMCVGILSSVVWARQLNAHHSERPLQR